MQTVTLGRTGITVNKNGFGALPIQRVSADYAGMLLRKAYNAGITYFDTARSYSDSEEKMGLALSDVRENIIIATKTPSTTVEGFWQDLETSLRLLKTDYIDVYQFHNPAFCPKPGDGTGLYEAMEEAKTTGKLHAIGVSNMTPKIWNTFVPQFTVQPAVNQVEFNPFFQQRELRSVVAQEKTKLEAYSRPALLTHPVVTALGEKYRKTAGQILLRFEVQEGCIVLPKSTNPQHMAENLEIFDFALTPEEMDQFHALDTGKGSHDPDAPGVAEMLLSAYDVHA